jgi:hypothetical protein
MKPHNRSPLNHAQVLRDHKQLTRLATKLQRTFESVERIQAKIARLLTRSCS